MQLLPELQQYLQLKKWPFRPIGDNKNVAIKTCPFCGKSKWKFYVHAQTTQYRCWHCDAKGNLYRLKRELGDLKTKGVQSAAKAAGVSEKVKHSRPIDLKHIERWHKALLADQEAIDYCKARGFSLEVVKHFKLGMQKKRGVYWLTIPHINDGVCHNVKFRSLPPAEKQFRRVKGSESVLFNADALAEHEWVVLCEAETDALSFWAAGIKNVVGLTCGAETFLAEWYDALADKERVVVCMDADAVGQQGARAIARRLGFDRCENVLLPMHDANEVLTELGADELKRAPETGEKFEVEGVLSTNDVLIQCTQNVELGEEGLLTQWHSVNRLLGKGWQPGDLVVLSAKVKVGKTTWALNIARHLAKNHNVPTLIYCLEMRPHRLGEKLVAIERKRPTDDLQLIDYTMSRYWLRRMPLYFIDPTWGSKDLKPEHVFDKIREVVKRHGIKLLVFDHLHFLCRSIQHLTNEVGQVVRGFKLLAEELQIVIILIAQPKKTQSGKVITYDDIKDSSAIPADADQVIIMHRAPVPANTDDLDAADDQEVLEPKTLVRVDAARFRGGGETHLYYDGALAHFLDWEDRPVRSL